MFSHATPHAKSSKKNTFVRRTIPCDGNIVQHKSEIVRKDRNGNYPPNFVKQPVFVRRASQQRNPEPYTPNHVQFVDYLWRTWQSASRGFDKQAQNSALSGLEVTKSLEKDINPVLKDFKPFDLEQWLEDQLYHKYTDTSS